MFDAVHFFCVYNWVTFLIPVWENFFAPAQESGYEGKSQIEQPKFKKKIVCLIHRTYQLCIIYIL